MKVPERGEYLWAWYHDAASMRRFEDGWPKTLSAPEWMGWQQMTGNIVRPEEWAVLRDMDSAHVSALCAEIAEQRARMAEQKQAKKGR